VQAYWGVQNIQEAKTFCVNRGATIHSEIKEVGENIKVATVFDPFGNILGLIENPNFKIG
jgi:predicted enzyme related to lactoylglutathione lyase